MITEDYVSLETAKLLKEKGFDEATIGYYYTISEIPEKIKFFDSPISIYHSDGLIGCIQAPTIQTAMKWLREEKKIVIEIVLAIDGNPYTFNIYDVKNNNWNEIPWGLRYPTYEEACEAAIKYYLENLI